MFPCCNSTLDQRRGLEPKVRIELTAYALPRRCSTTELLGHAGRWYQASRRDQVRGNEASHAIAKNAVATASAGNGLRDRVTVTATIPTASTARPEENTQPP